MKPPSEARKRTLALQERTLRFSTGINLACPERFTNVPSATVWGQLVRAADSTSNNLVEADDASSDADFLYKIELTLREAKESRQCLAKLRLGQLNGFQKVADLEREAGELCAIFATIAIKVAHRLERESKKPHRTRARGQRT
ncbi:MAG: four helix bundle protein [Acidobacteriota bacterium]|nr:four helix bundle protein [Acidobacteriota bacterium]